MQSKLILSLLTLTLTACSDPPPPTTPPTTQQKIEKDLKAAGENLKDAATKVAEEVDPHLHRAEEKAKEALHKTAEKIAEATAPTQPATQP